MKILIFLLLVVLPLQIGRHFWPFFAYIFGLRVDYLAPTVYLQDILILFLFFTGYKKLLIELKQKKTLFLILILLGLISANLFIAGSFFVSIFSWLRIGEFVFLGLIIRRNSQTVLKILPKIVPFWIMGEFLIGLLQIIKQSSLGGIFWYLGERSFNIFTPGIAKASVLGNVFLRPYGTFSHPNSLAGFILVGLIFIFTQKNLFWMDKIALLCGLFLLILCFSRTVWLAVLFLSLIYIIWRIIDKQRIKLFEFSYYFMAGAGLIIVFLFTKSVIETASFENRRILAVFALVLIKKYPFLGVGANNFLISLSRSGLSWPVVSFLQPVHNVFLLTGAETGLIGLFIFTIFLLLTIRKILQFHPPNRRIKFQISIALLAIIFTGLFDHYWLTLIQNQLLFVLVLGLAWSERVVE